MRTNAARSARAGSAAAARPTCRRRAGATSDVRRRRRRWYRLNEPTDKTGRPRPFDRHGPAPPPPPVRHGAAEPAPRRTFAVAVAEWALSIVRRIGHGKDCRSIATGRLRRRRPSAMAPRSRPHGGRSPSPSPIHITRRFPDRRNGSRGACPIADLRFWQGSEGKKVSSSRPITCPSPRHRPGLHAVHGSRIVADDAREVPSRCGLDPQCSQSLRAACPPAGKLIRGEEISTVSKVVVVGRLPTTFDPRSGFVFASHVYFARGKE